jgi:predicted nucleic acid-binding protein
MKILLDSVILIDYFNGISDAVSYVHQNRTDLAISIITYTEVLVGFDIVQTPMAKIFLNQFPILIITPVIAEEIAVLRQNQRWKLPDAIQAGIALHHHLQLATRNTKDFDPTKHSFVCVPYTI